MKLGDEKYAGTKEYLGDSVYALFDGYNMTLYLDNGYGPKSQIVLEPEVMNAFLNFVERLKYKQDEQP